MDSVNTPKDCTCLRQCQTPANRDAQGLRSCGHLSSKEQRNQSLTDVSRGAALMKASACAVNRAHCTAQIG